AAAADRVARRLPCAEPGGAGLRIVGEHEGAAPSPGLCADGAGGAAYPRGAEAPALGSGRGIAEHAAWKRVDSGSRASEPALGAATLNAKDARRPKLCGVTRGGARRQVSPGSDGPPCSYTFPTKGKVDPSAASIPAKLAPMG